MQTCTYFKMYFKTHINMHDTLTFYSCSTVHWISSISSNTWEKAVPEILTHALITFCSPTFSSKMSIVQQPCLRGVPHIHMYLKRSAEVHIQKGSPQRYFFFAYSPLEIFIDIWRRLDIKLLNPIYNVVRGKNIRFYSPEQGIFSLVPFRALWTRTTAMLT